MFTAAELIHAYSKDPINNYRIENASASFLQKNSVCGDEIEVFLLLETTDWILIKPDDDLSNISLDDLLIKERSRYWNPAIQTVAAASMLAEEIEWKKVSEVMTRDYQYMKNLWLDMSPRRRRSVVTALLGTRNVIYLLTNKIIQWFECVL